MNGRGRRARLDDIAKIAGSLRESDGGAAGAPDLTDSILARVDAQRPFLDSVGRRWVWAGRLGVAASAVLVVTGFVLTQRWGSGLAVELVSREAPLSQVVETVQTEATMNLVNLRATFGGVAQEPGQILQAVTAAVDLRAGRCSEPAFVGPVLAPGRAAAMDLPTERVGCGQGTFETSCRFKSPVANLRSSLEASGGPRGGAPVMMVDDVSPLMVGRAADMSAAPK